ncbi:unnamed protein product [Caretta caretta]
MRQASELERDGERSQLEGEVGLAMSGTAPSREIGMPRPIAFTGAGHVGLLFTAVDLGKVTKLIPDVKNPREEKVAKGTSLIFTS